MNYYPPPSNGRSQIPSNEQDSFDNLDPKKIVLQIISIWHYILVSIVLALGIAYLHLRQTVPQYEVKSKFFIKEKDASFGIFEDVAGIGQNEMGLVNQIIMLKSRPIAEATLRQLDFDVEYYTQGVFIKKEHYASTPIRAEVDWTQPQLVNGDITVKWNDNTSFTLQFKEEEYTQLFPQGEGRSKILAPELGKRSFSFGQLVELPYLRFTLYKTNTDNEGEMILRFRDIPDLVNQYTGGRLKIEPAEKQSSILELTLQTPTPVKGRNYLDKLHDVYLQNELEEKNVAATNTIEFIDAQLVSLSDSLMYIENRLESFRTNNSIYNLSSEGSAIFQELSALERELAQEEFKKEYYQQLGNYLIREDYNDIIVPSGLGIQDPILNTLIENLLRLQAEKSMHLARLTEGSPPVREVNRKIADLNRSIRELLGNVQQNAQLIIGDLRGRITRIEGEFSRLPQTEQNLMRIQREFTLNEGLYTYLLQKRAESAITRASNTPSNKVIENALINNAPISPRGAKVYAIAFMLGMILPIGYVIAKLLLENKVKDIHELEKLSDLSLLAQIPYAESPVKLVVFNQPRSGVTESFRTLRANLNFILPKDKVPIIMLTSNISGEGKSFCAMNLASVYALSGKKILLIGCDMRKPKLFDDFGLSNVKGLSSYLSQQEIDPYAVIQTTSFPNLDIIASGPIPPNPAELLMTDRFSQLVEKVKENFDMIILDTPPVGLVSESLELLQLSDLALFVLRYNYSIKPFIQHINTLKKQHKLKNTYLVFNGIDKSAQAYGYSGYGYGYGYYAEDKGKKFKSKVK
ncbi:GumC family protein [Pleomorphovibrio marinus]|uniref:GumC family protein n=1 Tax=Pleomorphovibrio marinus TaxID=2164132 RepID=UPI000E0C04E2|nr:polysaccharide biosynthesis tyrosine autokinase [Pleomorphovibrio marinus]